MYVTWERECYIKVETLINRITHIPLCQVSGYVFLGIFRVYLANIAVTSKRKLLKFPYYFIGPLNIVSTCWRKKKITNLSQKKVFSNFISQSILAFSLVDNDHVQRKDTLIGPLSLLDCFTQISKYNSAIVV